MYIGLVKSGQTDTEHMHHFFQEYDALHLTLTTRNGLPVETLWIRIEDFSEELGDEEYEAHFCVNYADGAFFHNGSL